MAAAPRDARADERVEQLALGKPQAGHDRDRHVREDLRLVADLRAPGEVPPEPLLGLFRDLHALFAGLLAVLFDAALACRRERLGAAFGPLDVGKRPDHPDLVLVHPHVRRARVPALRKPAGQPALDLIVRHLSDLPTT